MVSPLDFLKANPVLVAIIIVLPLIVGVGIFIFMRMKEKGGKKGGPSPLYPTEPMEAPSEIKPEDPEKIVEYAWKQPKPEENASSTGDPSITDLKQREERLKQREDRLKQRKITELQDKERTVERKHVTGVVKEELMVADEVEEKREQDLAMEEMRNNRKRLMKLIELAEDRYKDGLMNEDNFRSIMDGYQKELVEVDVEMAKIRV